MVAQLRCSVVRSQLTIGKQKFGSALSLGLAGFGKNAAREEKLHPGVGAIIEQVVGFEIKIAGFWLLIELGGISYGRN